MSLHIGNLSSRTREAELEHVFKKFGRCDVRLKDGYGFVVYDSPLNAEKALRALQGRNICGQPLTLTWSNKQPRPFTKFTKAARSYEPLYGSFSRGGRHYSNRKFHSNALQNYRFGIKRTARSGRNFNFADMLDENRNYYQDGIEGYIREEHCDYREDILDEGGRVEPNMLDNDRWVEQLYDQTNDNSVGNVMEFDHSERYQGYDGKGEDENHYMAYSGGSPAMRSSQEIMGREHLLEAPLDLPNDSKLLQICYNCGVSGHKMHSCPRENASKRKFKTVGCTHGDDIDTRGGVVDKLDRHGSGSHGELRSDKDFVSMGQLGNGRKASGSGSQQRLMRNRCSPEARQTDKLWRKDRGGNRRSRRDSGSLKNHIEKKTKRSVLVPLHSDCTESRSQSTSQSSKPVSRYGLRSRSRSVSSRVCSLSSDSRSISTSRNSGSTQSKSKSRPSSHTSLCQPLPTSPNKVQLHLTGPLDNAARSESKEILGEQGSLVGDARLESAKLENNMLAMRNENVVSPYKMEDEMVKEQPIQRDDKGNHMVSMSLCEITDPSTPLSDKILLTAGSLSSETLKETKELQNSDASLMVHMPLPIKKSHSKAPGSSHSHHSISISSEEMCMVLKQYGLKLPDENETHLPIEDYFGSARLWPWEIIYYRRWKKGPISTENHSRRVAQNQEFGIIDKYIRSSSGWGEPVQEYP